MKAIKYAVVVMVLILLGSIAFVGLVGMHIAILIVKGVVLAIGESA